MQYRARKVEKFIDRWAGKLHVIIKGPRQAGKTTLLKHLAEKYGVKYYTLEDPTTFELFDKDIKLFAKECGKLVCIDELQYSENAGRHLKYLYDVEGVRVIGTGSGSFDVKVNVTGHLVGRCVTYELLPLDFYEFVLWRDEERAKIIEENRRALKDFFEGEKNVEIVKHPALREYMKEYLAYGGYPRIVLTEDVELKKELLENLLTTYLDRDVGFFFGVRGRGKFLELVKALAKIQGAMVKLSTLAENLDVNYRTVGTYLSVLESTYVLFLVPPLAGGLREYRRSRRVYFVDQGLRNILRGNFEPDGSSVEAVVLRLLREYGRVYYWRSRGGAEVDFVAEVGGQYIPVEVKSGKGRVTRGLRSFIKKYSPECGVIFCDEGPETVEVDGTHILLVPYYAL